MEKPKPGTTGVVERHTSGAPTTEQHYPTRVKEILEKTAETCRTLGFFQTTKELSGTYPDFVAILRDGIERYKKIAEKQNLPWKGRIVGDTYEDDGEGPSYSGKEHMVIKTTCIELHSSNTFEGNTKRVAIVGSPDGNNVTLVRFTQTKMNEGKNRTGRKIVRYIQVDFRNGVPTELSIPPDKKSPPQK